MDGSWVSRRGTEHSQVQEQIDRIRGSGAPKGHGGTECSEQE